MFEELPTELIECILDHLDVKSMLKLGRTCKTLRCIANQRIFGNDITPLKLLAMQMSHSFVFLEQWANGMRQERGIRKKNAQQQQL